MVSIEVKSRSRSVLGLNTDELSLQSKVSTLVKLIATENHQLNPNRLRITLFDAPTKRHVPLDLNKSFVDNGLPNDATEITVFVKDLGPQIAWRTVFLVEYFGPLIFHPLFYFATDIYFSKSGQHTQTQRFAFVMVILHFIKRELETLFVHSFSQSTMPAFNIFKNSGHYWILSGLFLAGFIYAPTDFAVENSTLKSWLFHVNDLSSTTNYILAALWAFAELSNFKTHLILASLRSSTNDPDAPRKHVIPYGYGFSLVSYPNYFFESLSWVFFALLTNNWSAWLFLAVSSGQMLIWALKKHKKYLKTFGDQYKKLKRKAMIPFII